MTKIALITGANRGLGRQTALDIARQDGDVIVTYRGSLEQAEAVVADIRALGPQGHRPAAGYGANRQLPGLRRQPRQRAGQRLGAGHFRPPDQ